jgi:GAF domain-containing protein
MSEAPLFEAPLFEAVLAALTRYFVGDQTLGDSLHQVAELAMQAVPAADHVGITLLVDGTLKTSVFTHPEVPEIDRAQYRTGDGPCVDAYRTGAPYVIRSTVEPGRWQEFRDSAARHGVLSTLSLPMITNDGPVGALNLYAETEDSFTDNDQRVGEMFASHAAFLLANAQAYWDARTLSANLQQAMASRAIIEQAKGIIMTTMRCDEDEAIKVLIGQSQKQNIKLRELAAEIVRNASRKLPPHD